VHYLKCRQSLPDRSARRVRSAQAASVEENIPKVGSTGQCKSTQEQIFSESAAAAAAIKTTTSPAKSRIFERDAQKQKSFGSFLQKRTRLFFF
jgi:hypothetical protein